MSEQTEQLVMRLAMRVREMTDILSPEMMSSEVKTSLSSVSRCQDKGKGKGR